MSEVWKDIPGYEGYYQASSTGYIKSLPSLHNRKQEKLLTGYPSHKGYLLVRLSKNSFQKMFSVHRLIALTFIPNPYDLPQVNHKDEDKINNNVENLEWCTNRYNCNHGSRNERMVETKQRLGQWDCKKKTVQMVKDGVVVKTFESTCEASRYINGLQDAICRCCNHKKGYKSYKGFTWEYVFTDNPTCGNKENLLF